LAVIVQNEQLGSMLYCALKHRVHGFLNLIFN